MDAGPVKNVWVVRWQPRPVGRATTRDQQMWLRRDHFPTEADAEAKLLDIYGDRVKSIISITAEAK